MESRTTVLYKLLKSLTKTEILKYARKTCKHYHSLIAHPECLKQELGKEKRVGFLDIETSNLVATYGYIISYCIKEFNGKIIEDVMNKEDFVSGNFDKRVVGNLVNDLKKFDKVYTYYGVRFDLPFIRSRAVYHGYDFPIYKEVAHTDLYFIMRNKFKLHSNRLGTVCDFFGIKAKGHPLTPKVWHRAATGDKKALNYILIHNREDVDSTEKLYKKIIHFSGDNNTSI